MNKNKIQFAFILLLCGSTSWGIGAPEHELLLFHKAQPDAPMGQGNAWVLPRLAAERDISEKFSLKARVTLSTQKTTSIFEKEAFDLAPPSPDVTGNWQSLDKDWLIGQRGAKPLAARWTAKPGEALDLYNWDELWYEYEKAPQTTACTPGILLTAESVQGRGKDKEAKPVMAFANVATSLLSLRSLPLGKRSIVEKDYRYLASRFAHMEPDDVWRWAHEQKSLVIQRRMHLGLENGEVLEIAMRPGIQVEGVNLLVSPRDNQSPGELIEFPSPAMQPDSATGLPTLRLNLREALKQRFPDRFPPNDKDAAALKNWFVQEAFIFITHPPAQGFEQAPVESLQTLGAPYAALSKNRQEAERITLPSRVDSLGAGRARLVVDLNGLRKFQSLTLASIETRLAVPNGVEGCAIAPGKLYRVSTGQTNVPNYVLHGAQEWSKRLGGPYLFRGREDSKFESVEMQAYLPFPYMTLSPAAKGVKSELRVEMGPERELKASSEVSAPQDAPIYRLLGADEAGREERGAIWASSAGAELNAPTGSRIIQEGDALLLEGPSRQISVKWPVSARLKENSHLFVSLIKGADQVGYIQAALELFNGQTILRSLQPDTGLKLGLGENEVRMVTLTFHLIKSPFRIKLREAAIFLPKIMDEREASVSRYPTAAGLSPKPQDLTGAIATDAAEGRLAALMLPEGDGVARFKTALGRPLDGVNGIRLNFGIPHEWVGAACPLTMELVGSRASLARTLCFDKAGGEIYLPMAQWLATAKGITDIGALQEIRWSVRRPGGGKAEAFAFNWHIEGWRMANQRELIEDAILLKVGGKPFGIGKLTEQEQNAIFDGRRKFWLPMPSDALGALLKNPDHAESVENGVFQVEQIVLAPKTPIAWDKWQQLIDPPTTEPNNGWWIKLGFMTLSIGILVWLGRKGVLARVWQGLKILSGTGISALHAASGLLLGLAWRIRHLVNWIVVIMALGPGVYWAGTVGLTPKAFFAGFAMLILGFGALLHARPLPKWAAGIENTLEGTQSALRLSALIAILLAIWAVGALKVVPGAAFAFLPLTATAYWQLPRVASYGMAFIRRHPLGSKFLFFLAITLVLYAIGLFRNIGSGENYFFTFGGMVAVIALRYAILSLQPVMTRRWPSASAHIYRGGGALYFSAALAMLVATALLLALKLEPLAEQAAIVVYYCLVVGTVIEIAALQREKEIPASTEAPDQQSSP